MAEVYLVEDALEKRPLALKLLKADDGNRDYFMHEFRVLARLEHPNLVRVYDFETTAAACYYTCEYLAGEDLFRATADMDWDDLYDVVRQVLDALGFIHDRGLVHYDVKPENVNVLAEPAGRPGARPSYRVKLVDFGLTGEATTQRGEKIKGTVHYVAPEVAKSLPADRRADLYSLGITLYYCLTRRLPYDGGSALSIIRKHLDQAPEPPTELRSDLPEAWAAFVLRLLEKDPARRYPTAPAALADLAQRLGKTYEAGPGEAADEAGQAALAPSFVGRRDELARLVEALPTTARSPTARSVFWVEGEEGIGKTRLLYELKVQAQLQGVPFLDAACAEGGPPAFERIVRLASTLPEARPLIEERRAELDAVLPGSSGEYGGRTPALPPDEYRRHLDRIAGLLLGLAAEKPFALVLEDLRLADETTLSLLGALLRSLAFARPTRPPLIVLTDRPGERPARLEDDLALLEEHRRLATLRLERLEAGATGRMVASMLALDEPSPALIEKIVEATGGNPLFVEELVGSVVEEGLVSLRAANPTPEQLERIEPPSSVAELLGQRLARMEDEPRAVLVALGVLAAPAPLELLARTAGLGAEATLDALDVLLRRQMVRVGGEDEDGPPRYRLAHTAIQRSVVRSAGKRALADVHARALAGLESAFPEGPAREAALDHLARHADRAGDAARALAYGKAAGLRAQAGGNARSALAHFDRVLELIRWEDVLHGDERRREEAVILARLSEVLSTIGRYGDAARALEELLALDPTEHLGPAAAVWIRRRLGDLALRQGNSAEARRWLQEALGEAGEERSLRSERARVLEVMTRIVLWRGDYLQVIGLASEAVQIYRELGREQDALWALNLLCGAEYFRGQSRRAAEIMRECLDLARRGADDWRPTLEWLGLDLGAQIAFDEVIRGYYESEEPLRRAAGDAFGIVLSFSELGACFDLRADVETAIGFYQASVEAFGRRADAQRTAMSRNNLGAFLRHAGRLADALEELERALAIFEGTHDRKGGAVALMNIAQLRLYLGDHEGALARSRRVMAIAREIGITWLTGHCHRAIARCHAVAGVDLDADRELQRAAGVFRMIGNRRSLGDVMLDRAEVAAAAGDAEEAAQIATRARETGEEGKAADFLCRQALIQGELRLNDDPQRAVGELETALRYAVRSEVSELQLSAHRALSAAYIRLETVRLAQQHYETAQKLQARMHAGLPAELTDAFARTPEAARARETSRFLTERLLDDSGERPGFGRSVGEFFG